MVKHNNVIHSSHLRKHWMPRVKCFFNVPAHKKIRAQKRADKAAAKGTAPISKLRPLVRGQTRRYAHKVKFGRGFSLTELKAAKLTAAFAQSIGISVDHRRRNLNSEALEANVKRLNEYKSKLILFPRRDGKFKKGEVNDSTADALKNATQNTTHGVLALPRVTPRCKVESLTKELKESKVYATLRKLRDIKRNKARREKKAKDAAEAAALAAAKEEK
jgi:large subunit ribosomal protein L13e